MPLRASKEGAQSAKVPRRRWFQNLPKWIYVVGGGGAVLAAGIALEAKTTVFGSRVFHSIAEGKSYTEMKHGCDAVPPAAGPYDQQLGYARIGDMRARLQGKGYDVQCADWKDRNVLGIRLFQVYNEKSQAGLQIQDASGKTMYQAQFPRQAFPDYQSVPPLLARSLLFVEDRGPLDKHASTWNPAIDWPRFIKAGFGRLTHSDRAGGSTLATQIEKFRHSPGGVTDGSSEKFRQMLTASVRCYQDGTDASGCAEKIVLDYLNSMPLSSYPGFGAVNGYADGMALWFGTDYREAARLMNQPEDKLSDAEMKQVAKVYRESLSLIMSVKKPTSFLTKDRDDLESRIDKFLPVMARNGIISERMMNAVLAERVTFADPSRPEKLPLDSASKSVQALQVDLMKAVGVQGLYDLNRLDMTAQTTMDLQASREVTKILSSLADPAFAQSSGVIGYQLLTPQGVGDVAYSVTVLEKTADGRNVVRIQTDNFDGPLNLNEGTKLELGSTAKLRTLVTYLQVIEELHDKYIGYDAAQLRAVKTTPDDHLTRWAVDYLAGPSPDKSLNAMLEAALDRTYSGSPAQSFFTAGGLHHFDNFEKEENYRNYTVKDAFHHSVNLSFIRIMADIVHYTEAQKMNVDPAVLDDQSNPQRLEYLRKFADQEGTTFMQKFWGDMKDTKPEDLAAQLAAQTHRTPVHLAVVFRSLYPDAPYGQFDAFVRKQCANCAATDSFEKTFDAYAKDKFDINDRGYITGIHPLQLWMAEYRVQHPEANWDKVWRDAADARQESYKWLFKDNKEHAQDRAVQIMMEQEAFTYIHKMWRGVGYPFASLVPSYATSIGVSGDTPAALADLAGIIQNDGIRKTPIEFTRIRVGQDTPYDTDAHPKENAGQRVLPPEIAQLVRREMQGVVDEGTAKRAHNAIQLSDGRILPVGGKTGTGDNRVKVFARGGALKSSEAKSRTATFVFTIDDRFYGCVTAYVDGPEAGNYKFTSALAAQVFKTISPALRPMLDRAYGVTPQPQKTADAAGPAAAPKPPG